ncbi:unnamed protein product [Calicophoron daubneyi]|uniref:Serine aminopeptidase S33 domain-containing protein n=1 Tax=Calicophoron daubneyi TaxID=300641 RepID=A0AAV2T7Q0_CALDB
MFLISLMLVQCVIIFYMCLPCIIEKFPQIFYPFVFNTKNTLGHTRDNYVYFKDTGLSPSTAYNYYVESLDKKSLIGVWHIIPQESDLRLRGLEPSQAISDEALRSGKPVFIYFHGNSKSRATYWRVTIYRILSALDMNTIAFDYRGFGDSSGEVTSEKDCVIDSLSVLRNVYSRCGKAPVFFWGHSLGTGVVGSVVRHIIDHPSPDLRLPEGIILDAPFTRLASVVVLRRPLWIYRTLPYLQNRFATVISRLQVAFDTRQNLTDCPVPIMILHAEDDDMVPFKLGEKLAQSLISNRKTKVKFVRFAKRFGYKHNYIHTAPEIPDMISNFVQCILTEKENCELSSLAEQTSIS